MVEVAPGNFSKKRPKASRIAAEPLWTTPASSINSAPSWNSPAISSALPALKALTNSWLTWPTACWSADWAATSFGGFCWPLANTATQAAIATASAGAVNRDIIFLLGLSVMSVGFERGERNAVRMPPSVMLYITT